MSAVQVCVSRFSLAASNHLEIQGYQLTPELSSPAPAQHTSGKNLLFLHGYGGCKEEMLGLALTTTEALGATGFIVDLPGHGKSGGMFSGGSAEACMSALQYELRPAAVIGHSVGARLAMTMPEPAAIVALAPPLRPELEGDRQKLLRTLRQKRVREDAPFSGLVDVMERLGETLPAQVLTGKQKILLLRASSDLATVNNAFDRWKSSPGVTAEPAIRNSSHLDILTAAATPGIIVRYLIEWLQ